MQSGLRAAAGTARCHLEARRGAAGAQSASGWQGRCTVADSGCRKSPGRWGNTPGQVGAGADGGGAPGAGPSPQEPCGCGCGMLAVKSGAEQSVLGSRTLTADTSEPSEVSPAELGREFQAPGRPR